MDKKKEEDLFEGLIDRRDDVTDILSLYAEAEDAIRFFALAKKKKVDIYVTLDMDCGQEFLFTGKARDKIADTVIRFHKELKGKVLQVMEKIKITGVPEEEDLNRDAQVSPGDEISGTHGRSYAK